MKANKTILGLLALVMLVTAVIPVQAVDTFNTATISKTTIALDEKLTATIRISGDSDATETKYKAHIADTSTSENSLTYKTFSVEKDFFNEKTVSFDAADFGAIKAGTYQNIVIWIEDFNDGDGVYATTDDLVATAKATITVTSSAKVNLDDNLITDIDLDEDEVAPGDKVQVEIEMKTDKAEAHSNVKVKAWIDGLDGTQEQTSEFNIGKVSDDDEKTKILTLTVPEDADQGAYDLMVEVQSVEVNGGLLDTATKAFTVERAEDSLEIQNFNENVVSSVNAGSDLQINLEVLNNGLDDQTAVAISAEIVGTTAKVVGSINEIQQDQLRLWSGTLKVPANLNGRHNLAITVKSAEGATDVVTRELDITSGAVGGNAELDAVSGTTKEVGAAGAVFQAKLANTGSEAVTYELSVSGNWIKSSDVSPSASVTLAAGETKTVNVFVVPKDGTAGNQDFTLTAKANGTTVDTLTYTAKLGEAAGLSNLVIEGLQWIFAVLVVVAVVLFILWLGKKGGKKEGEDDKVYY